MTLSLADALPRRLPTSDRGAITFTLKVLRVAGYKPDQIFDEDEATYVALPKDVASAVREITGVDDATVLFKGEDGDSFYVRFVMGNDPTEVVCDHSWRDDEGDAGWKAFDALNQLNDRWSELEANA